MTHEKYVAFLEAAIRKTKSGAISWERANRRFGLNSGWEEFDLDRSFMCAYSVGQMVLAYEPSSGTPHCYISPDKTLPFQKINDDSALLLRLYNLVYSLFPSVDSFMDAMINSPDAPDECPF